MNELLNELVDRDLIVIFVKTSITIIFSQIKLKFLLKLTKDQREKIGEHFKNSNTRSLVEKRLLSYLNYNGNHLPMYAKPDMV